MYLMHLNKENCYKVMLWLKWANGQKVNDSLKNWTKGVGLPFVKATSSKPHIHHSIMVKSFTNLLTLNFNLFDCTLCFHMDSGSKGL